MSREKYSYGYAQDKYKPFKTIEQEFNLKLEENKYYIMRFDGKSMTKAFKIKHTAINVEFFNTMENTFFEFCKSTKNVIFGYSFSDEISILICGSSKKNSELNRIEKLLSLLSGKLALMFFNNAQKNKLNLKNKDWLFDARILQVDKESVLDYFLARQAFAIDKYLMQVKGENKIDYKLTTSQEVINELMNKGIDYNNLPEKYRYGLIYSQNNNQLCSFEFYANKSKLIEMYFNQN